MNTYDPATLYKKPKKKKSWKKGLVIFLAIIAILLGVSIACNMGLQKYANSSVSNYQYSDDYIGVLEVHGTMSSDGSDVAYNQNWLLERIDDMIYDDYNKGLMLSVDTPGGSVYTIDELYLKIKEYQTETGRPVYAYMESMAASGGYYISAPADKIYANRNCWTGSIGVTVGTVYDISGFLEELGIATVTITAGDNKAMGSSVEPLTDEQKEIYQGLVDEAYDQFVTIVSEGRKMNLKKVTRLADGRVYTAKQAKENGLIDEIGSRDEAISDMKIHHDLLNCEVEVMSYVPEFSFASWLVGLTESLSSDAKNEYDQIMRLMEENNKFTITYMSEVRK